MRTNIDHTSPRLMAALSSIAGSGTLLMSGLAAGGSLLATAVGKPELSTTAATLAGTALLYGSLGTATLFSLNRWAPLSTQWQQFQERAELHSDINSMKKQLDKRTHDHAPVVAFARFEALATRTENVHQHRSLSDRHGALYHLEELASSMLNVHPDSFMALRGSLQSTAFHLGAGLNLMGQHEVHHNVRALRSALKQPESTQNTHEHLATFHDLATKMKNPLFCLTPHHHGLLKTMSTDLSESAAILKEQDPSASLLVDRAMLALQKIIHPNSNSRSIGSDASSSMDCGGDF